MSKLQWVERQKALQEIIKVQKKQITELQGQLQNEDLAMKTNLSAQYDNKIKEKDQVIEDLQNKLDDLQQQHLHSINEIRNQLLVKDSNKENLTERVHNLKVIVDQRFSQLKQNFNERLRVLGDENQFLRQELEQRMDITNNQSIDQFSMDEEYLKQIQRLNEFVTNEQENYMAEIIHYKRELDICKQKQHETINFSNQYQKEMELKYSNLQVLYDKLERELSDQINTLYLQLQSLVRELNNKNHQILAINEERDQKITEAMEKQLEGQKLWMKEKAEILNQQQISYESQESKILFYENEVKRISMEKSLQLEKYIRDGEIMEREKKLFEKNIQEIKLLASEREKNLQREIQRLSQNHGKLVDLGQKREDALMSEINQLNGAVIELQRAYESRENLLQNQEGDDPLTNWQQLMVGLMGQFDGVYIQMRNRLADKKISDTLKEFQTIFLQLNEKMIELDQLRSVTFQKKAADQRISMANFQRSLEKLMTVSDTLYTKLEEINQKIQESDYDGNRLDNSFVNMSMKLGENEETNQVFAVSQNALVQTIKSARLQIEASQFEQLLQKKDADLITAKNNLVLFADTIKKYQNLLGQKINEFQKQIDLSIEEDSLQEDGLVTRLLYEKANLEKELLGCNNNLKSLQNELDIANEIRYQYENNFKKETERIEDLYNKQFDEIKTMIKMVEKDAIASSNGNAKNSKSQINSTMGGGLRESRNLDLSQSRMSGVSHLSDQDQSQLTNKLLKQASIDMDSIKSMLKEIEKVYLENERVNFLLEENRRLQERNNELEGFIENQLNYLKDSIENVNFLVAVPSKQYEQAFQQFKKECENFVTIKDNIEQNETQRGRFFQQLQQSFNFDQSGKISFQDMVPINKEIESENIQILQSEIQHLKQVQFQERDIQQKELDISIENLNSTLEIFDQKIDNYRNENQNLHDQNQKLRNAIESINNQSLKEVRHLKHELSNMSQLVNELQVQRYEDQQRYTEDLKSNEFKLNKKEQDTQRLLENRINQLEQIIQFREKINQEQDQLLRHDVLIDQQMDATRRKQQEKEINDLRNESEDLKEKIREIELLNYEQKSKISIIVEQLHQSISILHEDKAQLIEENNYFQKILDNKEQQLGLSKRNDQQRLHFSQIIIN